MAKATNPNTLPALSEADFQTMVVDMARLLGWRTFSVRQSGMHLGNGADRKDQYFATASGWPDLVLVRGKKIIFWELKTDTGKISAEQDAWLTALENVEVVHQVGCVRPRNWPEIEATLKGER